MKEDPIVAEVRRIRQVHAARFGYDLDLIVADLKAQEQASGRQYIRAAHTHVLRDLPGHKTTAMADRYIRAVGNPVREAREQVGAEMAAMMDGEGG